MDKNVFMEIKWKKEDVRNLLKNNKQDYSDEAVNNFISRLDLHYMEEKCIETGWEMLQSKIKENL